MATTTTPTTKGFVGKRVRRTEDPRLITCTATYVADITRPGVSAVYTGKDIQEVGPVPCAGSMPTLRVPHHKILAQDRVYYVGHPVVAVVASDRYVAQDAVDQIEVEYEPTDCIVDPEKSLDDNAVRVHPEYDDNVAFTFHAEGGDTDKAFEVADVIVSERVTVPRLAPSPMETRGVVAEYDEGTKELLVYSSTQIPHLLKTQLAVQLSLPENHVRVIAPEVGGGFGSKCNVWAEEALVCFAAMDLKQPIKWIENRRESINVVAHGRGHIDHLEMAASKDGTITALRFKILQDIGAHHQLLTPIIPTLAVIMIPGLYKIKSFTADLTGVFTNLPPTDLYRGAGRPEATYVLERVVDKLADKLGMDPAQLRLKNFPSADEFPFETATGLSYDSGDYAKAFNIALERIGYKGFLREQEKARSEGRLLGLGISTYGEVCAFGPSPALPAGGWESATVRVEATGKVTVMSGASPHGQGGETTYAQMAADALGIPMEDIVVIHGDTGKVHWGVGTFGSRGTAIGGTAVHLALEDVVAKGKKYAAHIIEASPASMQFAEGVFFSNETETKLTFQDLAFEASVAQKLPPNTEPGLSATRFFEPPNFAFPFGAHICTVEVDSDTGQVEILRYVAVDDIGNVINPMLVDGQLHGGVAQGLGPAFLEEVVFNEDGQLLTGTFMDYAIPKAKDMPWIESERTVTPSPVNPLGAKGVGEAGTIGSLPAFVNAVVDALSHMGVEHIDIPMTPQKVWNLINERSQS